MAVTNFAALAPQMTKVWTRSAFLDAQRSMWAMEVAQYPTWRERRNLSLRRKARLRKVERMIRKCDRVAK